MRIYRKEVAGSRFGYFVDRGRRFPWLEHVDEGWYWCPDVKKILNGVMESICAINCWKYFETTDGKFNVTMAIWYGQVLITHDIINDVNIDEISVT